MHRVLQIPELLREIVAELDDPYGRRRGHILAMALVCKIFHEPAMDALWAKLNSLKPLAYCVPPSAQHNDGTHLTFARALHYNEWERILIYTKRVKNLSIGRLDRHSLKILKLSVPHSRILFPGLRSLSVETYAPPLSPSQVSVIMGPKLHSCSFRNNNQGEVAVSLLYALGAISPAVHHLDIQNMQIEGSSILTSFHHLKTLIITSGGVSDTALAHIGALKTLERLSIPLSKPFTLPTGSGLFASLTDLTLYQVANPLVAASLLRSLAGTSLQHLYIEISTMAVLTPRNSICVLLDSIGENISLRTLRIQEDIDDPPNHPNYTISFDSLFPLRNLTSLLLYIPGFTMTETAIPDCALHWPRLEKLAVQPNSPTDSAPPALPLDALETFVEHFPSLSMLTIDVDATVPLTHPPKFRSTKPICLGLQHSLVNESKWRDVAAYISAVYPCSTVSHLEFLEDEDEDEHEGAVYWADIARMVPVMAKVREHEQWFSANGTLVKDSAAPAVGTP